MAEWLPQLTASAVGALLGVLVAFQLEHQRRQRELTQSVCTGEDRLDLGTVAFLLRNGNVEDLQAVQDALFAQRPFFAWRSLLAARNAKKAEAAELLSKENDPRAMRTEAEFDRVFGVSLKRNLVSSFKALPDFYEMVEVRLTSALDGLRETLTRNIPGHEFRSPNMKPGEQPKLGRVKSERVKR